MADRQVSASPGRSQGNLRCIQGKLCKAAKPCSVGVKCSHQRGCSHQQQLQLWANAEIKTLEMGQYTYYKLLFLATAGRTTWQAGFCLEIQVKDLKPCLKWNLKGEWTVEQREVGIPLAHLFGNLLHQELTSDPVCRQT